MWNLLIFRLIALGVFDRTILISAITFIACMFLVSILMVNDITHIFDLLIVSTFIIIVPQIILLSFIQTYKNITPKLSFWDLFKHTTIKRMNNNNFVSNIKIINEHNFHITIINSHYLSKNALFKSTRKPNKKDNLKNFILIYDSESELTHFMLMANLQ